MAAVSGEVQLAIASIATAQPLPKSGRLKAIAIGGARRATLMPEGPTYAERGYTEVQSPDWFGVLAPAGTPRKVIARIYRDPA